MKTSDNYTRLLNSHLNEITADISKRALRAYLGDLNETLIYEFEGLYLELGARVENDDRYLFVGITPEVAGAGEACEDEIPESILEEFCKDLTRKVELYIREELAYC